MRLEVTDIPSLGDLAEILRICTECVSDLTPIGMRQSEVSLVFVSENKIQELNRIYRGKDYVTDVLSFPLWTSESESEDMLGEIFICYNRAYAQSQELGHSVQRELAELYVHGLWHLMGYDHEEEKAYVSMREMEHKSLLCIESRYDFRFS